MRTRLLLVGTAWVFLGILPAPALAQQRMMDPPVSPAGPGATADPAMVVDTAAVERQWESVTPGSASRRVLVPLYIASAALQMMDVHSTRRAMAFGHTEGNPIMAGIASNTAAFVTVKAATAATAILVSERLRKRNRVAAIGLMVAVNVATATVVAHNYRVAR